jgi:hypothetical protein
MNRAGVDGIVNWLGSVREGRWGWIGKDVMEKRCLKREEVVRALKKDLEGELENFRNVKRCVYFS